MAGHHMVALVVDEVRGGHCALCDAALPAETPDDAFRRIMAGGRWSDFEGESVALAVLAPSAGQGRLAFADLVPSRSADLARRAGARGAILSADVPPAMREALLGLMAHPRPRECLRAMGPLRERCGDPRWDVLAFLGTHGALGHVTMGDDRFVDHLVRGLPVGEALAARWPGLTPAHLRRLRMGWSPAPWETDFRASGGKGEGVHVVDALAAIPHDWIPEEGGWAAFSAVAWVATGPCDRVGLDLATSLASSKGDWGSYVHRVTGRPVPPGRRVDSGDRAQVAAWDAFVTRCTTLRHDLSDPVLALRDGVVIPTAFLVAAARRGLEPGWPDGMGIATRDALERGIERDATRAAVALLYGGKSLGGVVDASAEWHERHARAVPATASEVAVEWPALLDGTLALPGGVEATFVHRSTDLADEGARGRDRQGMEGLDHCVLTRSSLYASGKAHLVSFRRATPDGARERLSCAEVTLDGRILAVSQHRGRRNAEPPPEASAAMARLAAMVRDGSLVPNQGAVARRDLPPATLPDRCGYDWRTPGNVLAVAESWASFLPRWARGLDEAGLMDALVARGALRPGWEEPFPS